MISIKPSIKLAIYVLACICPMFKNGLHAAVSIQTPTPNSTTYFIENKGQIHNVEGLIAENVRFVLERGTTKIFILREGGIAFQTEHRSYPKAMEELWKLGLGVDNAEKMDSMMAEVRIETYRMDMVLFDANPEAEIIAEGKSLDYIHYYNRNVTQVHHYERVIFREIYPGIDWIIYTTEQGFKYDFLIQPGANPANIKMVFSGQEELRLDSLGQLIHGNRLAQFIEQTPISFQEGKPIATRFILKDSTLQFDVGIYDTTQALTIDPNRIWGSYYGGSGIDYFYSVGADSSNFIYALGITDSNNNISFLGHQISFGGGYSDAFIVKFDQNGTRIWASYFGGNNNDQGLCITVKSNGDFAIAGFTNSLSGISNGGFQNNYSGNDDCFLARFKNDGTLVWSTYFGGLEWDKPAMLTFDSNSNIYLVGKTESQSNISHNGFQNQIGGQTDCFIVKFDSTGGRLWATYFGSSGIEEATCIAVDSQNNILIGGNSNSSVGIGFNSFQNNFSSVGLNGFLLKINSDGSPIWCSYVGSTGTDVSSVVIDNSDNIICTGSTSSTNGISLNGFQNNLNGGKDAYLIKLAPNSLKLFGTYFGSNLDEQNSTVSLSEGDNIFLTGTSNSSSNLAFNGFQLNFGGGTDAYVLKLDSNFQIQWSSYFGGSNTEICFDNTVINKNIYLIGITDSQNQIAHNGHQNSMNGGFDGFIASFNTCDLPLMEIWGPTTMCENETSILQINGGTAFDWVLPDGSFANTQSIILQNPPLNLSGVYHANVSNLQGCSTQLQHHLQIKANPTITTSNSGPHCSSDTIIFVATGAQSYIWSGPNGFLGFGDTVAIFNSTPIHSGNYLVSGLDTNGCSDTSSTVVLIHPNPMVQISHLLPLEFCQGEGTWLQASGANSYEWNTGDTSSVLWINQSGLFNFTGLDTNGCISNSSSLSTSVVPVPIWLTQPQNLIEQVGQTATLVAAAANAQSYQWESSISGAFQPIQDTGQYWGSQSQTLLVTNLNTINHNQQFRCIAYNSMCQDTSSVGTIYISGFQSFENKEPTNLAFPNPATNFINISVSISPPFEFTIADAFGRLVFTGSSNQQLFSLDVENWPSGWYFFIAGSTTFPFLKMD